MVTTLSTDTAAPVITGIRLRAGKTNSGKGAARMVAQAITTARAAGVTGQIIVRGDSAYGSRAVIRVCRRYGAVFSLVLTRNTAVQRAIDAITEDAWTPVKYPGAVQDLETGAWISDAEVAQTDYTMAKSGTYPAVTARLIVRRVKDANQSQDGLFPIWRYHPLFTNTTETATAADITHRRHAIIETSGHIVFAGTSARAFVAHDRAAVENLTTPHTPRLGAFQRRRQALAPDRAARAERLGALQVGRGLGEPQVGFAEMTWQLGQRLSRDCQCRHVLFTCFLVWWLSLR